MTIFFPDPHPQLKSYREADECTRGQIRDPKSTHLIQEASQKTKKNTPTEPAAPPPTLSIFYVPPNVEGRRGIIESSNTCIPYEHTHTQSLTQFLFSILPGINNCRIGGTFTRSTRGIDCIGRRRCNGCANATP